MPADDAPSLWKPLRQKTFRDFWLASLVSNFGTIMQSVGAAWLMTSLSASPVLVALVQTATNLPTFLLALPAGALADIVDRRRLILFTQTWMLLSAVLLGVLALTEHVTPTTLLLLTFSLGMGAALNAPVLQAIVPELVPREQLTEAITLNSAGFNLARAAGPALGGLVIAFVGAGMTFMINAASFVAVLNTVFRWRRERPTSTLPPENMGEAIRNGLAYARHAPAVRLVLIRAGAFIFFASALWALLPLVARQVLNTGPTGFGVLLGFFGVGAVLVALGMPRLRLLTSLDQLLVLGSIAFALALALLGVSQHLALSGLAMVAAGAAWMSTLSSFNTSIQWAVPAWVRGRTMALYLLVVFGGLSLGSPLWGKLASLFGLEATLLAAGGGMFLSLAAVARLRLSSIERMDLTPSLHWPEPILVKEPAPEDGPVVVTITYQVAPEQSDAFRQAMREVRRQRLRNGAMRWSLLHDQSDPKRFVETFTDPSWLAHMRQHQRPTRADLEVEKRAGAYHEGEAPPEVRHYLADRL